MPFFQISLKNSELNLSGLSQALFPTTFLEIASIYMYWVHNLCSFFLAQTSLLQQNVHVLLEFELAFIIRGFNKFLHK